MRTLWLIPRIFATTLGTGLFLTMSCCILFIQLQGGYLPLFLLWLAIAAGRWLYTFSTNGQAFAYLHNIIHSRSRLWMLIGLYELLPWLALVVINALLYGLGD